MNWRAISAIVRKDVNVALRTKAVAMPLVIVPLLLMIGVPLALGSVVIIAEGVGISSNDVQELQEAIPAALRADFEGLTSAQAGLTFALVYLFAPMYLILPLMVSSVVAADSFAGEKERRTIEALAYTPTTDRELLLAKMLAGWIPGVLVGLGGFVVYCTVVNLVSWFVMGRMILPNDFWLLLAFWVGPAAAGVGLGVTVLVSSRVNSFQEAYQLGSLVVLPVVFLMIGQIGGAFILSTFLVFGVGLFLWIVDIGMFFVGAATFKRSELIARM
jgi:ABC-2 type transport system permease protein